MKIDRLPGFSSTKGTKMNKSKASQQSLPVVCSTPKSHCSGQASVPVELCKTPEIETESEQRISIRRERIEKNWKEQHELKTSTLLNINQGQGTAKKSKSYRTTSESSNKSERSVISNSEILPLMMERSHQELEQLILDGQTLVSNVQVAAENREKVRQMRLEESRKRRFDILRQEGNECEKMLRSLSRKWMLGTDNILPLELFNLIKEQQKACDSLLKKKDQVISALRREIDDNDVDYDSNLKQYQNDVIMMGDRIEDHIDNLRLAFLHDLEKLEANVGQDRQKLMESNQREVSDHLQKIDDLEQTSLTKQKEYALDKFEALHDFYTSTQNSTREIQHGMEKDLATLIEELERIKVSSLSNVEKLDFNIRVLQNRLSENCKLETSVKKHVRNSQDVLTCKTNEFNEETQAAQREINLIVKDIRRLEILCAESGKKTFQRMNVEYNKYIDLWKMSEDEAREKLQQLLDTERYIFENQLSVNMDERRLQLLDDRPLEIQRELETKEDDVISVTRAKFKYPSPSAVNGYWKRFHEMADPKKKDLWNAIQYSYGQHIEVLKERNDLLLKTRKLHHQNYEMTHLLKKCLRVRFESEDGDIANQQ